MRFKQKLALKTYETKPFFEIKIGKYSLFETALFKIGKLHQFAENGNEKAQQELNNIQKNLKQNIDLLKEQTQNSKKAIELKLGYLPDFIDFIVIEEKVSFSRPLQCQLIQLVIVLDECLYWLHCAKNCELFDDSDFFINKRKLQMRALSIFSGVIKVYLKDFSR